jgi:hypothetical protein
MKDDHKTKEELIDELELHRQRLAELERKIDRLEALEEKSPVKSTARYPRVKLDATIEFIGHFDTVQAKGINFSEGGICFELNEALPFDLKFAHEGEVHEHCAHLIWMKRFPDGGYRFGLQFVPAEANPSRS